MSKWRRTGISVDLLKDFFYMFQCTPQKVQFSEGQVLQVRVADIIPSNRDWRETLERYCDVMSFIDNQKKVRVSEWWKHEQSNEVPDIQKRFNRFKALYKSIKKNGYQYMKRQHMKLLDLKDMQLKNAEKGGRVSNMYYRLNGMKRLAICNYLGINKIPCKIYRVRLG